MAQQFLQLVGILSEVFLHIPADPAHQFLIAVQKPPAEGNAVRLVIELLRVDSIEMLQFGILQYLRMKSRHSIDAVPEVDVHMCHVDAVLFIYNGNPWILVSSLDARIQILDNRHDLRRYLL